MNLRHLPLAAAVPFAVTLLTACAQLLDGDADYNLVTGTTAAGGTGGTGGAGGTPTTDSAGAGGSVTTTGEGGGPTTTSDGGGGTTTTTTTGTPCEGVDLQTNPDHCGACDHSCLGGDCEGGACQPHLLVSGLQWIRALAIDETHLYWLTSGDGKLERIAKTGAGREEITDGQSGARALLVDPDHIYWADPTAKKLLQATKTAGAVPVPFANNVKEPRALARTELALVVTLGAPEGLVRAWPLDNTPPDDLATGLLDPTHVITGATFAHVVDLHPGAADDQILRVPLTGAGASVPLATGLSEPRALADDGTYIYWAEANGTVARAMNPGDILPIAAGADEATGVAVDAAFVYWTQMKAGAGTLHRAAKDGTSPEQLASGLIAPLFVLVDRDAIYWAELGPMSGGLFTQSKIWLLAK